MKKRRGISRKVFNSIEDNSSEHEMEHLANSSTDDDNEQLIVKKRSASLQKKVHPRSTKLKNRRLLRSSIVESPADEPNKRRVRTRASEEGKGKSLMVNSDSDFLSEKSEDVDEGDDNAAHIADGSARKKRKAQHTKCARRRDHIADGSATKKRKAQHSPKGVTKKRKAQHSPKGVTKKRKAQHSKTDKGKGKQKIVTSDSDFETEESEDDPMSTSSAGKYMTVHLDMIFLRVLLGINIEHNTLKRALPKRPLIRQRHQQLRNRHPQLYGGGMNHQGKSHNKHPPLHGGRKNPHLRGGRNYW